MDILTALLDESEGVGEEQGGQEQADDLDGLFDANDDDEEEEYKEGIEEDGRDVEGEDALDLFGDVDDIENEEKDTKGKESGGDARESLDRSNEDLQGSCCCSLSGLLLVDVKCNLVACWLMCSPVELYAFPPQRSCGACRSR